MLAGAGFRDDALLAHAPREQRLTDGVIDLVRAGMVEIFALEPNLRTAAVLRQTPGVIDRAGTPDVVLELRCELRDKCGILAHQLVLRAQFVESVHQRLGDKHATVGSEVALLVGKVVGLQCLIHLHFSPL